MKVIILKHRSCSIMFLILLFHLVCFFSSPSSVMASSVSPEVGSELDMSGASGEVKDNFEIEDDINLGIKMWEFIQGSPTNNQLLLGMYTFHFDSKSLENRQWNNKLVGLQYNDFVFFVFENSFYNWVSGVAYARNLYQIQLDNKWDLNTGYRIGLMAGYEEGQAPFADTLELTPILELYAQFFYNKHYGVEIMLTSSISVGFVYQF